MKRILFILSFWGSIAYGQNTHVVPAGLPSTSNSLEHYGKIFNVCDYGAKHDSTTDDTQAIQAAVNACAAAGGGEVFFPNGIYIIGGAIQTSVGGVDMNCQIYVPIPVNIQNPVTINFVGESSASPGNITQSPFSTFVFRNMGVTLYSTYTGTRSTTNKGTSIIGTGENSPGAFNLSSFTLTNINFKAKANPNGAGPEIGGANGRNALGFSFENCTYLPDVVSTSFVLPTRDISGFEFPETGGGASYIGKNSSVCGLKWGFIFGEHVSGNQLSASLCYYGFGVKPSGAHSSTFQRMNAYWCVYGITWYQFGANPGTSQSFNVDEFDIEDGNNGYPGKYYTKTVYDVNDSTNKLLVNINYTVVESFVGVNNSLWSVNGGTGVSAKSIGSSTGFGTDGISVYTPSTGQVSVTKSTAADHGYDFTNVNASGSAHFAAIGTYTNSMIQRGSGASTYGAFVGNTAGYYTNSTAGMAMMVDANAPFTISTGSGAPPATRITVTGTGNVGIGVSPSNILDILLTQNAQSKAVITNSSAGASAQAGFLAVNNTGDALQSAIKSNAGTPYGALGAGTAYAYTGSFGGYAIMVDTVANFTVSTGSGSPAPERFKIAGTGQISLESSEAHKYRGISALRTLDESDYMVNCTANSFTVTLPTAVGITGRQYIIKNTGTVTTITIATTSSQTIDGSAPGTVTTAVPLRVMSDGANWITF